MEEKDRSTDPRSMLLVFIVSFSFWMLLTGSLDPQEILAGLLASLVVALASRSHLAILSGIRWSPALPSALLRYLGAFALALVKANLDMARRVLSPSLPIRPALVEVRTELQSDLGRLLLANSITLTPGTLTVDVIDDRLLVHWVDASPGTDLESATRAIVSGFENHLREFLH